MTIFATMTPSTSSQSNVRLAIGSAAEQLRVLEAKENGDKAVLRAVIKKFPGAEIKPLEDGRRAFVSAEVKNAKHTLRFIRSTNGGILHVRRLAQIKVPGHDKVVEVWSQETWVCDQERALTVLNEAAAKVNPEKLPSGFAAIVV